MSNETNMPAPSLADCLKQADETKELIVKKNALEEIPRLLDDFFSPSSEVCLISDENTWQAAGKKVQDILEKAGKKIAFSHVFPGEPRLHAEYSHVRFLKEWLAFHAGQCADGHAPVPFSIGAGTINDLVKCCSGELKLPYLSVPTAASVDGFTPNGAALLMDGFKQTIPCSAPKVVAADIDIIANAPPYLASSGFGDLAGKIIAGTDWIIAEKAGKAGAPEAPAIDKTAWAMTQAGLSAALKKSVNAVRGDHDSIQTLFESLAITGFAMQYYKNSRPVSGSEHLFSHLWEMEDLSVNGVPVTHGHKVAIGTLAAAAFTEIFFANPDGPPAAQPKFRRPSVDERKAETFAVFKENRACERIVETSAKKLMDEKTVRNLDQLVRDSWKEIRSSIQERLPPYAELRSLLENAGCPLNPETIGVSRTEAIEAARKAQMIRNKYGILDLAWDLGVFETVISKLESSEIYLW